uniref:Uncharacterized protein n=1 Tax=Arundo donax TaxID=35708 RepID=A0A0A9EQE3_ARUDO
MSYSKYQSHYFQNGRHQPRNSYLGINGSARQ